MLVDKFIKEIEQMFSVEFFHIFFQPMSSVSEGLVGLQNLGNTVSCVGATVCNLTYLRY